MGRRRKPGKRWEPALSYRTLETDEPQRSQFVLLRSDIRALLILILAIAAFLRFYHITTIPHGLYGDEAMNGSNALEALETHHFKVFYPENNGREGLFINTAAVFVHFFGNKAWVLRLPSAIFGTLTVWGVYLLAAWLFGSPTGLLASFFVATSFWHLNFSRIAFRAIASPFFLVWGLYFLLAGIERLREGKRFTGMMVLAGVVYGLGFHTYISYRATPLLIAGVFLYYFSEARHQRWLDKFWIGSALFAAAAFLIVAPLAAYFLRNPGTCWGHASQISILQAQHPVKELAINTWKTVQMLFLKGDANWRHNYSERRQVFWPVAIFLGLGIIFAIHAAWKNVRRQTAGDPEAKSSFPYWIILGWLAITAGPVAFSDEAVPHALRAILMIPPVFILAAIGGRGAYAYLSHRIRKGWLPCAAIIVLMLLAYEPYRTYFELWAPNPWVWLYFDINATVLAEQVKAAPKEIPKVVVVLAQGVSVNGIPMPAQPIMFLTKSYTQKEQDEANIHYLSLERFGTVKPVEGMNYCDQVSAALPYAKVFCQP